MIRYMTRGGPYRGGLDEAIPGGAVPLLLAQSVLARQVMSDVVARQVMVARQVVSDREGVGGTRRRECHVRLRGVRLKKFSI